MFNVRGRRRGFGQTGAGWIFGFLLCVLSPMFWRASNHLAPKIVWATLFVLGVLLVLFNAYIVSDELRNLLDAVRRRLFERNKR